MMGVTVQVQVLLVLLLLEQVAEVVLIVVVVVMLVLEVVVQEPPLPVRGMAQLIQAAAEVAQVKLVLVVAHGQQVLVALE
jgi:hypothetical protein